MTDPKAHADAGRPYQPSNGTEGEYFFESWCCKCQRDRAMREGVEDCSDEERCGIIGRTMAFQPGDAEYPVEWQYGKDGQPMCTAFVPIGDPTPMPRCDKTRDMFEA